MGVGTPAPDMRRILAHWTLWTAPDGQLVNVLRPLRAQCPDGLDVAFPTDSNGKEGRVWPLDPTCKLRMDSVATDASVSVFGKDSLSLR